MSSSSFDWVWKLIAVILRSLKVILRWILGNRELERILGHPFSDEMPYLLGQYIHRSKELESIQAAMCSPSLDVNTMYQRIVTMKHLSTNTSLHQTHIQSNLKKALTVIHSYNAILRDMEEVIIPFDTKKEEHRSMLFELWSKLDPIAVHSRLTDPIQEIEFSNTQTSFTPSLEDKAWEFIGFQGDKPWTDFRAVGLFGLKQLIFFAKHYPRQCHSILSRCMQYGQLQYFSFAITGINITFDVMQWFRRRNALLFYSKNIYGNDQWNGLDAVHVLYCISYVKFHEMWIKSAPKTVMEYGDVHKEFLHETQEKLENDALTNLVP